MICAITVLRDKHLAGTDQQSFNRKRPSHSSDTLWQDPKDYNSTFVIMRKITFAKILFNRSLCRKRY